MRDVREALMVTRNTDGKLVRRPMSPHLQVYRWPLSMMLSISHRATGCGLGIGTLMLTWWLVAAAVSDNAFATVQWFLGSWLGILCMMGWAASLVLHLLTGLRHLAWDAGYGFEPDEYTKTGWGVVVIGVAGAGLLCVVGLAVWLW